MAGRRAHTGSHADITRLIEQKQSAMISDHEQSE